MYRDNRYFQKIESLKMTAGDTFFFATNLVWEV